MSAKNFRARIVVAAPPLQVPVQQRLMQTDHYRSRLKQDRPSGATRNATVSG